MTDEKTDNNADDSSPSLVGLALDAKPDQFKVAATAVLYNKVQAAIVNRRSEVAKDFFNQE